MHSAARQMDRRSFMRKPCSLPADLDGYDKAFGGLIRNLGKGGAFVQAELDEAPEIGREFILTIPFKQRADYLIIKARVAWVQGDCMGVIFLKNNS